jgi:hypothetical protein
MTHIIFTPPAEHSANDDGDVDDVDGNVDDVDGDDNDDGNGNDSSDISLSLRVWTHWKYTPRITRERREYSESQCKCHSSSRQPSNYFPSKPPTYKSRCGIAR